MASPLGRRAYKSQRAGPGRDFGQPECARSGLFIRRRRLVPNRAWLIFDVSQKMKHALQLLILMILARFAKQYKTFPVANGAAAWNKVEHEFKRA